MKLPTYLRCADCGWNDRNEPTIGNASCPECGGFLLTKKTQIKSSPKRRPNKTSAENSTATDQDGFKLKKTKGGWKFVEGKKRKSVVQFSKSDEKALNACLRRRGLYRTAAQSMVHALRVP